MREDPFRALERNVAILGTVDPQVLVAVQEREISPTPPAHRLRRLTRATLAPAARPDRERRAQDLEAFGAVH